MKKQHEIAQQSPSVLVTGGAGFIGSWLCKSLLEKHYKVICIDSLITGNKNNIKDIIDSKNFVFLQYDVTRPVKIKEKIDFIFHLASPASPIHYQKHPIETMLANSLGTLNMLELAEKNGAKLLYASSSEVYGDPKEHPQKETYRGNVNPVGPRACYDESKRFGEALITSFPGAQWTILRLFNTYGHYMNKNDGRAVPNFINQALNNEPITVYGSGEQTRSFCYVSDMVDGIEKAMFSGKAKGEVINIGNPDEITILELANLIIELTDSKSEIIFNRLPEDDPARRRPDITKAREILNWEPRTDIRAGMKATVNYFAGE